MSNIYTEIHKCPKCRSSNTRRVRRRIWMRLLTSRVLVQCYDCGLSSLVLRTTRIEAATT